MTIAAEPLLSLSQARKLLPGRGSWHPTARTLLRWIKAGIVTPAGRVRLEATASGGMWTTSEGAIRRFQAALTAARGGQVAAVRTPSERQRQSDEATRKLVAMGW